MKKAVLIKTAFFGNLYKYLGNYKIKGFHYGPYPPA